jgi:hypothetical protein
LVDTPAAGLGVDTTRGLRPGAMLAQLGQRHPTGRFQQVVLGPAVGRGGVADGRGLFGRKLPPAGGGRRRRQRTQTTGGVDGGRRLDDGAARPAGQLVGGRPIALGPPRARLGQAGRGQPLESGRDLLDTRRLVEDLLRLRRRQHARVESGGVPAQ